MKIYRYLLLVVLSVVMASCGGKYSYDTVKGDPTKTRIYTLENGLKVYLSVNKDEPRIQTNIAVRVGGKNDPAETTGLAHYFEHLMFKGTQSFGTSDYEAEKPMLDEIEALFEVYRKTTDEKERAAIYKRIDSISYEASKIAIPNEYDKLMSAIGASGTNAYTSNDVTAYVEDIPSNQIENWAKIQSDRFKNPILRGFHTELETIYEEKNMSLTNDSRKVFEAILSALYENHPYGTQTVLGTQEHLKNPSITNVRNYHAQWYVPNNMAVCMSGDFNPDEVIEIIDRYFGDMKPNPELPKLEFEPETPISTPKTNTVLGLEAENVTLAWRAGGAASKECNIATLAGNILYNGEAGLMDLNLNHQQKVLSSYGYYYGLTDYGMFLLQGRPKAGQSLDDVKDLMLDEVAKLASGDFDESLLAATVNNYKAHMMSYVDSNRGRVQSMVESFVNGTPWNDNVKMIENLGKVTKEDIVNFAKNTLKDNNYIIIYKREGRDPNEQKMPKPELTPIATNRDVESSFLTEIKNTKVQPIEPVFVDYDKDLTKTTASEGVKVLYKKNETNGLFDLIYMFDIGSNDLPTMNVAFKYLDYLGTADKSAAEIKKEFYTLACSYYASVQDNRIYIVLSGLSENMNAAMKLFEELVAGAQPQDEVLTSLKDDMLKSRSNAKLSQSANFGALRTYATYGPEYIKNRTLTNDQLNKLTSDNLINGIRELMNMEHSVLYYGPVKSEDLVKVLKARNLPENLNKVPEVKKYHYLPTSENKVLLAQYDAAQIYFIQTNNTGRQFNVANDANVRMYNEYFGGGMNSIVFQEMREARGLAYSSSAFISEPRIPEDNYFYTAFIATQNDKMSDAVNAFEEIINNMPVSENAFSIAKESIISRISTQRTIKSSVLWSYIYAQDMGVNFDREKPVYEKVKNMTLDDVIAFQKEWIKDGKYTYSILGDIKDLDQKKLKSMGKITKLSQEEIFGF